jgi:carbon storage regulator
MLVLTRRPEDGILITLPGSTEVITITVLGVEGDKVKVGIAAPRTITVLRQELCEAVRTQNLSAAQAPATPQTLAAVAHLFPANGHAHS